VVSLDEGSAVFFVYGVGCDARKAGVTVLGLIPLPVKRTGNTKYLTFRRIF